MSRIEQIISDMEAYLDSCKKVPLSSDKIMVEKDQMLDFLEELRLKTPEEIKKYQRILANSEAIINDAKNQANAILNEAQVQTEELVNEHEVMQRAVAQADSLVNSANENAKQTILTAEADADNIRMGALGYTDDMLEKLQRIIEHAIRENQDKYESTMTSLQNVLNVVETNRNELASTGNEEVGEATAEPEETAETESAAPEEAPVPEENVAD